MFCFATVLLCRGAATKLTIRRRQASFVSPSNDQTLLSYNTRTRRKEPLQARVPGILCSYICGPTVYDSMHLGHAYTYTQFDIVRRIVESTTSNCMLTCMNITDIDDKIIKRARDAGSSHVALADRYEQEFWRVLQLLSIRRPEIVAPVSKYIPAIIRYIEKLIADGHAYIAPSGSVYFDVQKCGSRHGIFRAAMEDSGSGEVDQEQAILKEKRNHYDFSVWKNAKPDVFGPDEPQWAVPWDANHRGRPGWHTECAALSTYFFDRHVDIHFGGADLQFPHHENERSQNLCFHDLHPDEKPDQQWVSHWLHFGTLLNGRGEKMSKSKQNYIRADEFLLEHGSNAAKTWRMFCCLNHYRSHPVFRTDSEAIDNLGSITNVRNVLAQIDQFRSLVDSYLAGRMSTCVVSEEFNSEFLLKKLQAAQADTLKCLLDDFDVPGAMKVFLALLQQVSAALSRSTTTKLRPSTGHQRFHSLELAVPLASYLNFVNEFYAVLGLRDDAENTVIVENLKSENISDASKTSAISPTSYSQSYVERIIDDTVAFRSHVRQVAISFPAVAQQDDDCDSSNAENNKKVLLDGCDALRQQLASRAGVLLRDSKHESFWVFAGSPSVERKAPVDEFKSMITKKVATVAAPKKKIFIKKTKQPKPAKTAAATATGGKHS